MEVGGSSGRPPIHTIFKDIVGGYNNKFTPEIIIYYNKIKFGIDIVGQMTRKYTVNAAFFEWLLQVFFDILDLAAINAWLLYKECTGSKLSRKDLLFQLIEELVSKEKEDQKH